MTKGVLQISNIPYKYAHTENRIFYKSAHIVFIIINNQVNNFSA